MPAGCSLGGLTAEISGEDSVVESVAENTGSVGTNGMTVGAAAGGPWTAATDQSITYTFTGGIIDTDDAGTSIPGLTIYNLSTNNTVGEAMIRGTEISYTAVVHQTGANTSTAELTLDLTNASDTIEVFMDAATITANGETVFLDGGDDDVTAETEDDYIEYLAVTGGTAVTAGEQRDPNGTIGYTAFAYGGGNITSTFTDTVTTHDFSKDTLDANVQVEQMVNGAYSVITVTTAYNSSTGVYTIPVPVTDNGTVYKVSINEYGITEANAKGGYTHRGNYDQVANNNIYAVAPTVVSVTAPPTFSVNTDSVAGEPYIEIDSSGTYIDTAALTSANISLYVTYDADDDGGANTPDITSLVDFTVQSEDDNTFRLYLPVNLNIAAGDDYEVVIQPVVTDKGADLVATTDDLIHIDTTSDDGSFTLSGTF